jgi:F-type H+-transporting ATPase subunit b
VSAILEQLEINSTFFIQLAIFAVLYFILRAVYFRPFMALFEHRHQRTVADREAAEKLMAQANSKFDEYRDRLSQERQAARKDYELVLEKAKKEEASILAQAREEAKKITQEAAESISNQREKLKAELQVDVESMAKMISEKLLSRKGS